MSWFPRLQEDQKRDYPLLSPRTHWVMFTMCATPETVSRLKILLTGCVEPEDGFLLALKLT